MADLLGSGGRGVGGGGGWLTYRVAGVCVADLLGSGCASLTYWVAGVYGADLFGSGCVCG